MILRSGDKAIATTLRRSPKGLEVTVHLHEAVAEFIRASAGEQHTPLELFGRRWLTPAKLEVYDLPISMEGPVLLSNTSAYRLDRPGNDMFWTEPSSGLKVVNMSFIRLVGAAQGEGITFCLAGAFDRDDVIWLGQAITEAGNIIYKKYIVPMVISTSITLATLNPAVPNGI